MFDVKIHYREPLHELWSGAGERDPFVARYRRIEALDSDEAQRIAECRFRDTARVSQVRWQREVVDVVVETAR